MFPVLVLTACLILSPFATCQSNQFTFPAPRQVGDAAITFQVGSLYNIEWETTVTSYLLSVASEDRGPYSQTYGIDNPDGSQVTSPHSFNVGTNLNASLGGFFFFLSLPGGDSTILFESDNFYPVSSGTASPAQLSSAGVSVATVLIDSGSGAVASSTTTGTTTPNTAISTTKTTTPNAAISTTKPTTPNTAISTTKPTTPNTAISTTKTTTPNTAISTTKTTTAQPAVDPTGIVTSASAPPSTTISTTTQPTKTGSSSTTAAASASTYFPTIPTASTAQEPGGTNTVAIRLSVGLGVPLALTLLAALVYFLVQYRRGKRGDEGGIEGEQHGAGIHTERYWQMNVGEERREMEGEGYMGAELECKPGPAEVGGRPILEIGGRPILEIGDHPIMEMP